ATQGCFTPAVPCSRWCSAHSLQLQRVRSYMTEVESDMTSKPSSPTTDSRTLSTLRAWLTRARS
ncbi:hypothetical protein LCGC14_2363390, partial [marine sediment metagenome]